MPTKKQNQYREVEQLILDTDPMILLECCNRCDGHTIFKHQMFLELGLDERITKFIAQTHTSAANGDPKHDITSTQDGRPIEQCYGVYGLQFLRLIANAFDLEWEGALGRGTEARRMQEAIQKHFSD